MPVTIRHTQLALLGALLALLLVPAPVASAKWVVLGAGWGHGVGLSQYGAYGYAQQGKGHRGILRRYYKDASIGETKNRGVGVLVDEGEELAGFSGADRACGRRVNPDRTYRFDLSRDGERIHLERKGGRRLTGCGGRAAARSAGRAIELENRGTFRGNFLAVADHGEILEINRVGLQGYLAGVVPNEMPASWSMRALRAQAVAARSYALATEVPGQPFDHYDDTRSQVYNGLDSENPRTNRAVRQTNRQVVRSDGIATTYFFSTSGGATENKEYGFIGSSPEPYLKARRDPYDEISPEHRWREAFTQRRMNSEFCPSGSRFNGLRVLEKGRSPRVVTARIRCRGTSNYNLRGDMVQWTLGLQSTWYRFRER